MKLLYITFFEKSTKVYWNFLEQRLIISMLEAKATPKIYFMPFFTGGIEGYALVFCG